MLAACFSLHCPIISSVLLMANRQTLQKCVVLALCHNLQCIHVGSWWGIFLFFFEYVCALEFATGYLGDLNRGKLAS